MCFFLLTDNRITACMSSFASGLVVSIGPLVEEIDGRLESVFASQENLLRQLKSLSSEVDTLNLESEAAQPLDVHVKKIVSIRKRTLSISKLLNSVQNRLEAVDTKLSKRAAALGPQVEALDAIAKAANNQ